MFKKLTYLLPVLVIVAASALAQFGGPRFGGGGFGPPGWGRGDRELVDEFDQDDNGWLNAEERQAARESMNQDGEGRGPRRGGGGRFGRGGNREPAQSGRNVSPDQVEHFPNEPLYASGVLRTLFLDFESDDWESELESFKGTDVDVPATLTVDGKTYPGVGVHFRGASSYMMVPTGYKRSLNLSLDTVDEDQRLYGYKTLNLLNCAGDSTLMSTVLYSDLAGEHLPTPKANFVEVVINGESWGVYTNVQQMDKIFTKEHFASSQGTRWKVPGSPGADGGLRYLGDDLDGYKSRFEMKSDDGQEEWDSLVELCKVLNETPIEELPKQIEPILDVDQVLWFLAYDVALVNSDGYWTRASDYYLFRDSEGVFHTIPHDMNEAFISGHGGGPPGGGRRGGGFRGDGPPGGGPPGFGPPQGGLGGFDPPESGTPGASPFLQFRGERPRGPEGQGGPPEGQEGDRRGRGGFNRGPGGFGGRGGGPGGRGGGPGGGGPTLDPLVGIDNDRTPLRSRLLQVPEYRERYLAHVEEIAERQLDWQRFGEKVERNRALIDTAVEQDTRKLTTTEAFRETTATDANAGDRSLKRFVEQRSEYLKLYQPAK